MDIGVTSDRQRPSQLKIIKTPTQKAIEAGTLRQAPPPSRTTPTPRPSGATTRREIGVLEADLAKIEKQRDTAFEDKNAAKFKALNTKAADLNQRIGKAKAGL